jgi:hypothetical protein
VSLPLGESLSLRVGQSAEIRGEGLSVGLSAIRDDSRCPPPDTGIVCIWEGVATAVAWASRPPEERQELILHTSDNGGGFSRRAEYLDYEIEVLGLTPPRSREIHQSEYVLSLVVRRR